MEIIITLFIVTLVTTLVVKFGTTNGSNNSIHR